MAQKPVSLTGQDALEGNQVGATCQNKSVVKMITQLPKTNPRKFKIRLNWDNLQVESTENDSMCC